VLIFGRRTHSNHGIFYFTVLWPHALYKTHFRFDLELGPKMWTLTCQQFIALILLGTLVPSESFLCKHCFRKNLEKVHESFRDILSPPIFGVNPQPLIEVQQPKVTPKPEVIRQSAPILSP